MNTGAIIFVTIILLIVVVAIAIISIKKKKKEKYFIQSLSRLAWESNSKISDYQMWHNTMIAVDREGRRLFFLRKSAEREVVCQVNLGEIKKCRVAPTCRSVSNRDHIQIVTERIELAFTPRIGNNPETFFEFYNSKQDSLTLKGELQLAEKWAGIANTIIAESRTN